MNKKSFETNVSEQLSTLKIEPGENAWLSIEKHLIERQKKRRGIFFLLLGILIVAGGSFFLFNNTNFSHQKEQAVTSHNTGKINQPALAQPHSDADVSNSLDSASKGNANLITVTESPSGNKNMAVKTNTGIEKREVVQANKRSAPEPDKAAGSSDKNNEIVNGTSTTAKPENLQPNTDANTKNITAQVSTISSASTAVEDDIQTNIDPSLYASVDDIPKKLPSRQLIDFNKEEMKTKGNDYPKSWRMGIHAGAGLARMGNSFFQDERSNFYTDYSSVQGPGMIITQIRVTEPLEFRFGIDLEKNISKNSMLSTGIEYNRYSFSTVRIDSSASSKKNHSNYLHYVNIPVSFAYTFNNHKRMPILWRSGVLLGYLAKADLSSSVNPVNYLYDDTFLNKLSFSLTSQLLLNAISNQNLHLRIGPYIRYNLTEMADKGTFNNKHFSSIGITTELIFLKKEKK